MPVLVAVVVACTAGSFPARDTGPRADSGRAPTDSAVDTASDTAPDTAVGDETGDTGTPPLGPFDYAVAEIPPGTFTMGSPADEGYREAWESQHPQQIARPYALGLFEVTQGEAEGLLGWNPAAAGVDGYGDACDQGGVDPALPVACLTWFDAVALANAMSSRDGLDLAYRVDGSDVTWDREANGWRLPTEAEWEYAARAGSTHTYGVTSEPAEVCAYANVADDTATTNTSTNYPFPCDDAAWLLTEPGRYAGSAWGLHDMLGNVYEWAWDWSGDYPAAPVADYAGPDAGTERVRRGGGWHSGLPYARPAYRGDTPPDQTLFTMGVRLARNR